MKQQLLLLTAALCMTACDSEQGEQRAVGELASDRIELTVEFNEPIVDILVAEGETVTPGQVLLLQDDARARARLAEYEAALRQNEARLDELIRGPRSEQISAARANVEGATQDLEFKQSELTRIREIHERGLASTDALDAANAALDGAQAALKLRLAQLEELLAGTTIEELAQAEQAVLQAAARRDGMRVDLDRHTIKAPGAGILDSRLFEAGERPTAGQPALVLLAGEQPHARVFVPEELRVRIAPGSKAIVFIDGIDTPFDGRVRWVASEPAFTPYYALTERDRGRLSYIAKVDLIGVSKRLPDGVPVEVEFVLDSDQ